MNRSNRVALLLALSLTASLGHACDNLRASGRPAGAAAGAAAGRAATSPVTTGIASMQAINLNTADAQELMRLKGVGAKRAQAIIDYRNQHGKFRSVYELRNIKGIGLAFIEKNQACLTLQ